MTQSCTNYRGRVDDWGGGYICNIIIYTIPDFNGSMAMYRMNRLHEIRCVIHDTKNIHAQQHQSRQKSFIGYQTVCFFDAKSLKKNHIMEKLSVSL